MANPFTSFQFPASGSGVNTNISMPDRLAYIKNVKDFGAKGDGVTDDWAAITNACFTLAPNSSGGNLGTVFFPPGTYYISQSIDLSNASYAITLRGVGPLSQITGNFADYLVRRFKDNPIDSSGNSGVHVVEHLGFLNTNANGGGIRWGLCNGASIRNCNVVANFGINTANHDIDTGTPAQSSLELNIESCTVSAYTPGTAGTFGIMSVSDGSIINCHITGYAVGLLLWGGEGAQNVLGCYFEANNQGIHPGVTPLLDSSASSLVTVSGCYFKNNGTGLEFTNPLSSWRVLGCYISGDQNVTVFGARPQYGIQFGSGEGKSSMFAGVTVTGQYDQYAIFVASGIDDLTFYGVSASNNSSNSPAGVWGFDPAANTNINILGCSSGAVFTVADLAASPNEGECVNVSDGTNGLAWGATVTNTGTHTTHYKVRYNGSNFTVVGQ